MGFNANVGKYAYPGPGEDDMRKLEKSATFFSLVALGLLSLTLPASADDAPAIDAGCVDCHGADGLASENLNAPVIAGIPAGHIEEAIYAYRDGARQCRFEPMMCETVLHTSEERIAELAEYYAAMPRDSSRECYDAKLAFRGKEVHERLCSGCHLPPDHPDAALALGIPLHGQRGAYIRYALESYMDGRREKLLEAMARKLAELEEGDIDALVNYYASY